MQFHADGLTLWYGTEDTPAPQGNDVDRESAYLTVGVRPSHPSNRVVVQYRIDTERVQSFSVHPTQSERISKWQRNTQYFKGKFPSLWRGQRVEYRVTLHCAGRQVPSTAAAQEFTADFGLAPLPLQNPSSSEPSPEQKSLQSSSPKSYERFPVSLDYLGRVSLQLQQPPEIIGETPENLKINWHVCQGSIVGPKLSALIRPNGEDRMTLRSDGIGILDAHVTLETQDGALIYTSYSGIFELGEDGYRNFLSHHWPDFPTIKVTPRFLCDHPRYKWLNRLQCIGIGVVQMSDLWVVYDLYIL